MGGQRTIVIITHQWTLFLVLGLFLLAHATAETIDGPRDTDRRLFYLVSDSASADVGVEGSEIHLLDSEPVIEGQWLEVEEEVVKRLETDILDKRTLIKLHGTFMVVAWMGTTTIGVLIARSYIVALCGSSDWKRLHCCRSIIISLQVLQTHLDQETALWHTSMVLCKFTLHLLTPNHSE